MTQLDLPHGAWCYCADCKAYFSREAHSVQHAARKDAESRLVDARRRRDSGILRSEESSGTWVEEAYAFLCEYARTHPEVFCDSLWEAGLPPTTQPKALGAVFVRASKAGVIERVGYRASKSSRLSPKPLWRSLVFRGQP